MQCSVTLNSERNRGKIKMKTFNNNKNPCKKELNIDKIVDQLSTRLEDQESPSQEGMPTCSIEQAEAVRRYYAAFPALKKGKESPLQYYLPPPLWCRKTKAEPEVKMQCELSPSKDWNQRNKKLSTSKERRNSYQGQKRNRKRCNSYSRSFESKDNLPEWVTYEGVWDMENQDPVKEFIRAIALDEGYGTCENTVTDDIRDTSAKLAAKDTAVPDWDDELDLDTEWVITDDLEPRALTPTEEELYAKFEAKFDHSIEALWAKDQNTPDDEYQDLPIDFHDLLSSPSDHLLAKAPVEKCALDSFECASVNLCPPPPERDDSAACAVSALPERFRPLNLADPEPPVPVELESFALYEGEDIYEALTVVANSMRSFTAINHSRDTSGFVEVPPRKPRAQPLPPPETRPLPPPEIDEREDLLTSARTHFRPIRREIDAEPTRYADGDTFDIRGDLDPVEERRSARGGVYVGASNELYFEYRAARTIHYGRLNLTPAQRCPDLEDSGLRLRFPVRQRDTGVQTERPPAAAWPCEECGRAAKKMRAGTDPVWGADSTCAACAAPPPSAAAAPPPDLAGEWEELLSDISAAHARLADEGAAEGGGESRADRKRRHSAALRCAPACTHPHARFLPCCALALDRPLTR
ncbi:uncharacterized protein LOC115440342 isoform X1 [Manduca sexta]|uniref:uncharacterized protein LOC115440342 isoform X1 n=2 Tax=Manduca sexta TaxID=7130 RepID=UPI00188FE897|nr:uncharacterized protein LOC115440342 isoform X1 [Manduca sexta]XP_030020457.2 uncharacterized protein LOC115440342 isoform X1 [Manduca sexta]XP_030020458.2 uncharacterized protein LOC115440342 isoform X1 [Manduca sexta]XP_030020459.2 uncharacterized protein LOC115440342 isoform X1 [Manduca sexta]